ncbi:phosphotransferase [uncultured Arthrobacter sp.]|uniref:phosphotransferase n=1 Tax=uncultured Arthrobacter sp. TaxID=114050 RepID=UPI002624473B|nr:phosphotransferase [uncultured Arthrobacter sp.]
MTEAGEVSLLEGPAVEPALATAAAQLIGRLEQWSLRGMHHRPGAGVTGIYAVRCRTPDGQLEGFLCLTTRTFEGTFPRSVRLRGPGGIALLAWSHPNDPLLPDLAWACDANSVGAALFGVRAAKLTTLGYRPMRRAVLRAEGAGETRFLKVLRQDHVAPLRRRHELLLDAGIPVPQPLTSPRKDVLVTMPAKGTPLASRLMLDGAADLAPRTLIDLLERLPQGARNLSARPPWSARVRDYARAATAALPAESARIAELAVRVEGVIRTEPAGPVVATHGDFYEGNLLIENGQVTGVLDLDGVGPGHLVDDLACFLAHLAVLPCVDERYVHVPGALTRFQGAFEERVEASALRARTAGVVMTLIAGARKPGQNQPDDGWRADALRRLRVAEHFLGS